MRIIRIFFLVLVFHLCVMNFTFAQEHSAGYYDHIGLAYAQKDDPNTAIIYFKKAIQQDPNYLPAYINLAVAYGRKDEYDKGIEVLTKALEINPGVEEVYVNLSAIYEKQKNYDLAIESAKGALSLNRKNTMAIYLLGSCYIMQGKTEMALAQYRKLSGSGEDALAVRLLNKIIQKSKE